MSTKSFLLPFIMLSIFISTSQASRLLWEFGGFKSMFGSNSGFDETPGFSDNSGGAGDGFGQRGFEQGGFEQGGFGEGGFEQGGLGQGGFEQGGLEQGGLGPGGFEQGGLGQGGLEQLGQGGFGQGGLEQLGQGGFEQGGFGQRRQGGFEQGGFGQGGQGEFEQGGFVHGGFGKGGFGLGDMMTQTCTTQGPCYGKKLTCPESCFKSINIDREGYKHTSRSGGCSIDCIYKCTATC